MPSVINFGKKSGEGPVAQQLKMHSGKIELATGTIIQDSNYYYSDEFDCPQGNVEFDCGYDSKSNYTGVVIYNNSGTYKGYFYFNNRDKIVDFSSSYIPGAKCRVSLFCEDLDNFYLFDYTSGVCYGNYKQTDINSVEILDTHSTQYTGSVLAEWDFITTGQTSAPAYDSVRGLEAGIGNNSSTGDPYRNSSGLYIRKNTNYIELRSDLYQVNRVYEFEFGNMSAKFGSSSHGIILGFLTDSSQNGALLSWHYQNQCFATWDNETGWQDSTITDKNYFANSTVKIEFDNSGYVKWYKDNELIYTTPSPIGENNRVSSVFRIGKSMSTNTTFYDMYIKNFKVSVLQQAV